MFWWAQNIQGNPLFSANLKQRKQLCCFLDFILFLPFVAPYSPSGPLKNQILSCTKILLKIGHKIIPESATKLTKNWLYIIPKSAPNHPKISPSSAPKSAQNQTQNWPLN
jgi:hypothetical protein